MRNKFLDRVVIIEDKMEADWTIKQRFYEIHFLIRTWQRPEFIFLMNTKVPKMIFNKYKSTQFLMLIPNTALVVTESAVFMIEIYQVPPKRTQNLT